MLNGKAKETYSINIFRKTLFKKKNVSKQPTYFAWGKRHTYIIYARLRHYCLLNFDLFKRNIICSRLCSCGKEKDAYHFCRNILMLEC